MHWDAVGCAMTALQLLHQVLVVAESVRGQSRPHGPNMMDPPNIQSPSAELRCTLEPSAVSPRVCDCSGLANVSSTQVVSSFRVVGHVSSQVLRGPEEGRKPYSTWSVPAFMSIIPWELSELDDCMAHSMSFCFRASGPQTYL